MKRVLLIFSLCLIVVVTFFIVYNSKYNVHTDLSGENIDNLYLLSDVNTYIETIKLVPVEDVSQPGYVIYPFESSYVTVKEENDRRKIYRIATISPTSTTSKNVSIGTTLEKLINIYGENYTQYRSDQVDTVIKYKDKHNGFTLIFYIYQNKVDQITFEITDYYQK